MICKNFKPAIFLPISLLLFSFSLSCAVREKNLIDREILVNRHLPKLNFIDAYSPFTVGNGDFAFTADVTGFQTLTELYNDGIPLEIQSNWGWHKFPNINGYRYEDTFIEVNTYGRLVPYAGKRYTEEAKYFRANPHRMNLANIKLIKVDSSSIEITPESISEIKQVHNIWEGKIESEYKIFGKKINVETCVDPNSDRVAFQINSNVLEELNIGIQIALPYPTGNWGKISSDWESAEKHRSELISNEQNRAIIEHILDSSKYYITINWEGTAHIKETSQHQFVLKINEKNEFKFSCNFSETIDSKNKKVKSIFNNNKNYWSNFWNSGGAIDLSESKDTRALELERRIILSQFLTAIQCSGILPPQETGLTINSWHGKFHLEMHWWHAVHFVLWNRPQMLENSLGWYKSIIKEAENTAKRQGYEGVRWPKMVGPEGLSSPSKTGEYLIWQQPHPIYYAELLYQFYSSRKILVEYQDIVFKTADFMSSFPFFDDKADRYILGPPLKPAQEIYNKDETFNSPFEISYWEFGLRKAIKWAQRLGIEPNPKWSHVLENMSKLPQNNGFYQNAESALNTFQDAKHRNDHPTVLGVFGLINYENIDTLIMLNTLKEVMNSWNWEKTWGWDYPMIAMNAARLGKPEIAIDALLLDVQKNTYLNNGHNYQSERLPIYLPGNGGLLTAVAMMAAGWENAPNLHAPGFPKNGNWKVKLEGLQKYP